MVAADAAEAVKAAGYDPYEKKILGITAMTNLLGKKKFQEILAKNAKKTEDKTIVRTKKRVK